MFTSRAEYRLILREDNADTRLAPIGERLGLLGAEAGARMREKGKQVAAEIARVKTVLVPDSEEVNRRLGEECESSAIKEPVRAFELLRRPEVSYAAVLEMANLQPVLDLDQAAELEIEVKYEGYVKRQAEAIERFKRLEDTMIPEWIDFHGVSRPVDRGGARPLEVRPPSLGAASPMR